MDSTCSVFGCREHDNEDTEMRNFSINCVIIVHFEQLETWKISEEFGQDGVHICLAEPHNFAFILCENIYHLLSTVHMGRDSSVGIATRYGLGSPGIESRWGGETFRTIPDRQWGPHSFLYNWYRAFSRG